MELIHYMFVSGQAAKRNLRLIEIRLRSTTGESLMEYYAHFKQPDIWTALQPGDGFP